MDILVLELGFGHWLDGLGGTALLTADRDFAKAAERAKLGAAVELLEWREEKA